MGAAWSLGLVRRGVTALAALPLLLVAASTGPTERVGGGESARLVLPVNQVATPAGQQVWLPGMRPQALALSPDGRLLAVAGKTRELVLVDPASGAVTQKVPLPSEQAREPQPSTVSPNILKPDTSGQLSFTGLVFAPDGRRIYLSNVNGSIKVFSVAADDKVSGSHSLALPPAGAPRRAQEIPAGLALSADGSRLYAALNLSNRLAELDTATGQVLRLFDVGAAPFDVTLAGGRAYVSNWGGGRPRRGESTGPAGRGTLVKVDPVTYIANEGSVSVIDLASGELKSEVLVRLHASALALAPDRVHLVCANAASDNLSVIDTRTDRVVETIWVKPSPAELFGASPNALAFAPDGRTLYVANGTQNAVAVVDFAPARQASRLAGLIPVGWFPGALAYHAGLKRLCVANIKGFPGPKPDTKVKFNSHQAQGSLSLVPVPDTAELPRLSQTVWDNMRRDQVTAAALPPRKNQPPRPIPERIGEPSLLRHVVYIIKENRTYDQVLGDIKEANGDPELCVFGERVTPNQHKLAREFVLLDNAYCCGILSADGHQWSTSAFGTDYLERSFAGWPRSYPDGMGIDEDDALAYAPSGFLWDNARRAGKTLRNFGEFAMPKVRWADPDRKGSPDWTACYREFREPKGEIVFASEPSIESLRPDTDTGYVGWHMPVPDVWRAQRFLAALAEYDRQGELPNLIFICLPNDHTSGTSAGSPTPAACVADNDLALGQIIEGLSRSRFWPQTAVFVIEDDPQAGWDHVSGYRTTAYVASPYARRGQVVSTQYNTTSLIRTMEQILGLPPMNQFDASATPMFDCFTAKADLTPFVAVPNNVPLDEMNGAPRKIGDAVLRRDALVSARLNFARLDACPEDVLNQILWRSVKGSAAPYPQTSAGERDADD